VKHCVSLIIYELWLSSLPAILFYICRLETYDWAPRFRGMIADRSSAETHVQLETDEDKHTPRMSSLSEQPSESRRHGDSLQLSEAISTAKCNQWATVIPGKLRSKHEHEERRKSGGGGGSDRHYFLTWRHKFKFAATKVPRQCPLVPLIKVGLVKVRRLEVEKVG
jgi:hypothetical protein